MGGVMSRVHSVGINELVLGRLTPEEGLQIFRWAVKKEAEIEKATPPEKWAQVKRDSMKGGLLRERGEDWFKQLANSTAKALGNEALY